MTANSSEPERFARVAARGAVFWVLFEWARNPYVLVITVYVYATYFTRDIVGDPVRGQALWAAIQGYSGLAVAVTAPFLGAIADAGGRRKPWIAFFAVLLAGSLVFHGAMLPSLVQERQIGRWSGLGYALGNVAGIVLLIFVLAFIYLPAQPLFGLDRTAHEHERISGPLCALWFAVFSLPFFLWAPDRPSKRLPVAQAVRRGLASVAHTIKSLSHYRNVAAYLGVRMIYNDGLNVMLSFGGVYAAGVFHWGVVESASYGILLSIFAALGGLLGGRLADNIGTKRALQLSVGVMIAAALLSLGFAPDRLFFVISYPAGTAVTALPVFRTAPELFYIATVMLIAMCLVATYANSRAMMARIAPESRMTEFFGLYALSGEATAFMAPLAVALATKLSRSQQWGMAAIIGFLAIGFAGLAFVREERAVAV